MSASINSLFQAFDDVALSGLNSMEVYLLNILLSAVFGLIFGLVISFVYTKTSTGVVLGRSMAMTIMLITLIFPNIIMLVGNNMARVFSLAGVMALVRFRSVNAEPRDLGFILFAMAAGLACGVGMYVPALCFVLLVSLILLLLHKLRFGVSKARLLKINLPEDKNYVGLFDETLKKFTEGFELLRVRTTDLGSLYELTYEVVIKDGSKEKEMMDELRCLNGNLDIMLVQKPQASDK